MSSLLPYSKLAGQSKSDTAPRHPSQSIRQLFAPSLSGVWRHHHPPSATWLNPVESFCPNPKAWPSVLWLGSPANGSAGTTVPGYWGGLAHQSILLHTAIRHRRAGQCPNSPAQRRLEMAAMQRVPRSSLGRVSSLDFDAWRQIERDMAMRMRDVTANVGIRVERFGLRAIKAEHQLFLLVHGEFIPRPLNHIPQGCSGTERMGLSHAIEDDADLHFLAAGDVDSFVFAGFKVAVVSQFFIRIFDTDAPFLGLELAQVALFAETLD